MPADHIPPAPPSRRRLPSGLRHLALRPRLAAALTLCIVAAGVAATLTPWRWPTVALVAWNLAALLLIGLDFAMMEIGRAHV
jgi:hypothetical protein